MNEWFPNGYFPLIRDMWRAYRHGDANEQYQVGLRAVGRAGGDLFNRYMNHYRGHPALANKKWVFEGDDPGLIRDEKRYMAGKWAHGHRHGPGLPHIKDPMRAQISTTNDGQSRIHNYKRKRYGHRQTYLDKKIWKGALKMMDWNVYRKLQCGSVTWNVNDQTFHTYRLFSHLYQKDGGGAGIPRVEWDAVLDNLQDRITNSAAQAAQSKYDTIDPDINRSSKTLDPITKLYVESRMHVRYRNNSGAPVHVTMYIWEAKQDILSNSTTTTETTCDYTPDALWKNYLGSDFSVNSNQTAANLTKTFVSYLSDAGDAIRPFWKCIKVVKHTLKPGDEADIYVGMHNRIINMNVLQTKHLQCSASNGAYIFRGERMIQTMWRGGLTHDGTTVTNVGMNYPIAGEGIDWAIIKQFKVKVLPVFGRKYFNFQTAGTASVTDPIVAEFSAFEHDNTHT